MGTVSFLLLAAAIVALCPTSDAGFRFIHMGHGAKPTNCGKKPNYVLINGKHPRPPRPEPTKPAKPAVATPSLKTTTVLGGLTNTQILTCHTTTPRATYTFYRNGKKLRAGKSGKLVLKNLVHNTGKYSCKATAKGKKSKPSKVYELAIKVTKPVAPTCVPNIPATGPVPGGHMGLNCKSPLPGKKIYTFYKNGKKIRQGGNPVLTIKNLDKSKNGKYSCKVTINGAVSPMGPSVVVKVTTPKPPTCVAKTPAGGLVHGGQMSLSCKSTNSGKKVYTFFKNGKKISSGSNPTLVIKKLDKSKSGMYSCTVAVNGVTSPKGPGVEVVIKTPPPARPTLVPSKKGTDLQSGGHQTLTCESSAKGKKTYIFYKDGKKIRENGNHELELSSLDKSEAGEYSCVVKVNGVPSKKSPSYILEVQSVTIYQPTLKPTNPKHEMPAGLDQILTCETKNKGDILYTFLKDGKVVQSGKNPRLTIQDLTPADSAKYSCRTTMAGHDSHPSHPYALKVKVSLERPTLTCSLPSSHVWVDDSVTLTCGAKATKGMTYIFYKGDKEIHKGASNKYSIKHVKAANKGIYSCASVAHGHKSDPSNKFEMQVMEHCNANVDLLFLVDKSASIKPDQFKIAKSFIQKMVAKFIVKPDVVRVGSVLFANGPHNGFCFDKYTNNAAVDKAIGALSCPKCKRGKTATGAALQYARENSLTDACGAREEAKKIIVVITDGKSTEDADFMAEQTEEMKMIADEVLAVGVGKIKRSELEMIATQNEFVFTTDDFSKLEGLLNNVATKTCEAGAAGADNVDHTDDEDWEANDEGLDGDWDDSDEMDWEWDRK